VTDHANDTIISAADMDIFSKAAAEARNAYTGNFKQRARLGKHFLEGSLDSLETRKMPQAHV